jgi:hypothetical protein
VLQAVLQIWSFKQDDADLSYSEAFIYRRFSDVVPDANNRKTVFAKTIIQAALPAVFGRV